MASVEETSCCGVREVHHLDHNPTTEGAMLDVCTERYDDDGVNRPFMIFTDITRRKNGKNFAAFIRKNELGIVMKSRSRVNGNSGNPITIWVWDINDRALNKWYRAHRPDDEDTW